MFTRFKQRLEQYVVSKLVGNRVVNINPRKIDVEYTPTDEQSKVDHSLWTTVLSQCVKLGKVRDGLTDTNLFDYNLVLHDSDLEGKMNQYMEQISNVKLNDLNDNERCATLINLYNVLAIKTILDAMKEGKTLVSITDLSTRRQSVWKRPAFKLTGKQVALDNIEHDFLRAEWNEPRVHACVVCASMSCPNLLNEAYVPDRLDAQMTEQMNSWLANPTKGVAIKDDGSIQISRIFLWFQGDFTSTTSPTSGVGGPSGGGGSNEVDFIRKFRPDIPATPAITYFDYNWSINAYTES